MQHNFVMIWPASQGENIRKGDQVLFDKLPSRWRCVARICQHCNLYDNISFESVQKPRYAFNNFSLSYLLSQTKGVEGPNGPEFTKIGSEQLLIKKKTVTDLKKLSSCLLMPSGPHLVKNEMVKSRTPINRHQSNQRVGLVLHLMMCRGDLTASRNPLKLYNHIKAISKTSGFNPIKTWRLK